MMTVEEQDKRLASVRNLKRALFKKAFNTTSIRLWAYNILLEPPAAIQKANDVHAKRLRAESEVAYDLYKKLEKEEDKLRALPSIGTYKHGDKIYTLIYKGMLPNFEETSEKEEEALKMLADYYARESA